MRITMYRTMLDDNRKNILVKEKSCNYSSMVRMDTPEKIVEVFERLFNADRLPEEYVWMIAVDTKHKPIGIFEIGHGSVNASIVGPREVFVRLCLCGAAAFFLVHNHPSGEVNPSKEDRELTKEIAQCGKLMRIPLVDHIIIGNGSWYSFAIYDEIE